MEIHTRQHYFANMYNNPQKDNHNLPKTDMIHRAEAKFLSRSMLHLLKFCCLQDNPLFYTYVDKRNLMPML